MDTLYLCGAGNAEGVRLALRVDETLGRWQRIVLLDDDPAKHGQVILGVRVEGPFSLLKDVDPTRAEVVNLVARTTGGRHAARQKIAGFGVPFTSLISDDVDTLGAELHGDVTVYPNATIGPGVSLGPGCVVFMGAVVGHGSTVGSGCVMAANSVLNARVDVEDYVYVGTNATVLPEIRIGEGATVGAGSSVIQDVPRDATVIGVPARLLAGTGAPSREPAKMETGPDSKLAKQTVVDVWRRVLDLEAIDPAANFFDLGGSSLQALQVREALHEVTGRELALVDMFQYPTIEALARRLSGPERPAVARRRQRPAPPRSTPSSPPVLEGELLATVVGVFESVLETRALDPDEHFFDFGGDTARAHVACERLQQSTGHALCHMHIARFPTPRRLAEFMATLPTGGAPACPARGMVQRLIHHEGQRVRQAY